MNWSIIVGCSWLIAANVIAMFPSPKRQHWPSAYVLIAVGLPLLLWMLNENGTWIALLFLAAGGSVLRWPVRYLFRWLKRLATRAAD